MKTGFKVTAEGFVDQLNKKIKCSLRDTAMATQKSLPNSLQNDIDINVERRFGASDKNVGGGDVHSEQVIDFRGKPTDAISWASNLEKVARLMPKQISAITAIDAKKAKRTRVLILGPFLFSKPPPSGQPPELSFSY